MIQSFIVLLPVFIVILIGLGLRRSGVIAEAHWVGIDQICYFVLFPTIIFKEIAAADFSAVPVWSMAISMMLAITTMFALLLVLQKPLSAALRLDGPQFSSLFQGATRFHTFIALAIIPIYFGQSALALGGLSAAAMIPLLNIVNVGVLSANAKAQQMDVRTMLMTILKNPFVLSSLGGILWQVSQLPLPVLGVQVLDMIGKGALGLALLAVGAGLRIEEAISAKGPVITASVLKLLLMPVFMALWLRVFCVTGEAAGVAILCGAVPTGSGAYVLAKQLGGDAAMVANILTLQVICAAITIPFILSMLT